MEKSTSIKEISKALLTFQMKMEPIKKDSENPFYKNKYASLSTILEHIQIPLAECGLAFSQMPDGDCLCTILMHTESGEYLQSCYSLHPQQINPQGLGSAITYARRYALGAILGLNIDIDDDAQVASQPVETKKTETEKEWLNKTIGKNPTPTKKWNDTVEKLKNGTVTVAKILEFYNLSKVNREELLTYEKK